MHVPHLYANDCDEKTDVLIVSMSICYWVGTSGDLGNVHGILRLVMYPSPALQQIYQLCHFLQESPILDGQARSEQTDGPSYTCHNFLSLTNTENAKS